MAPDTSLPRRRTDGRATRAGRCFATNGAKSVRSRDKPRIGTPVDSPKPHVSKGIPMKFRNRFAAYAALAALACTSVGAYADDHAYTEGVIVNVARIRTVDGRFD